MQSHHIVASTIHTLQYVHCTMYTLKTFVDGWCYAWVLPEGEKNEKRGGWYMVWFPEGGAEVENGGGGECWREVGGNYWKKILATVRFSWFIGLAAYTRQCQYICILYTINSCIPNTWFFHHSSQLLSRSWS
jgi:hypothetical protein